jgi:hypothetical protein
LLGGKTTKTATMKYAIVVVGVTFLVGAWRLACAAAPPESTDVFVERTGGYFAYRIPAIETAPDGSLLAEDGGATWLAHRPGLPVSPVACAIERYTLKAAGDDRNRIIWTGPKGPDRQNLVLRISYDEGSSFPVERLIAAGHAAYSDLTILRDRSAGVLWERGIAHAYQFITFMRLTREFIEP